MKSYWNPWNPTYLLYVPNDTLLFHDEEISIPVNIDFIRDVPEDPESMLQVTYDRKDRLYTTEENTKVILCMSFDSKPITTPDAFWDGYLTMRFRRTTGQDFYDGMFTVIFK